MINKTSIIEKRNGKYILYSKKKDRHGRRKNLGQFKTLQDALDRERQINYFKFRKNLCGDGMFAADSAVSLTDYQKNTGGPENLQYGTFGMPEPITVASNNYNKFIKRLYKIASSLDKIGFFNYASEIDSILFKLAALSRSEALSLLEFSPYSNPDKKEISSRWKSLAVKHHPDKGGDIEKMKDINNAKDTLFNFISQLSNESSATTENENYDNLTELWNVGVGNLNYMVDEWILMTPLHKTDMHDSFVVVGYNTTRLELVAVAIVLYKNHKGQIIKIKSETSTFKTKTINDFAIRNCVRKLFNEFNFIKIGDFAIQLSRSESLNQDIISKIGPTISLTEIIDNYYGTNKNYSNHDNYQNPTLYVNLDTRECILFLEKNNGYYYELRIPYIINDRLFLLELFKNINNNGPNIIEFNKQNKHLLMLLARKLNDLGLKKLWGDLLEIYASINDREDFNIDMMTNINGVCGNSAIDNANCGMFSGLSDAYFYSGYSNQEGAYDHTPLRNGSGGYNREELERKLSI